MYIYIYIYIYFNIHIYIYRYTYININPHIYTNPFVYLEVFEDRFDRGQPRIVRQLDSARPLGGRAAHPKVEGGGGVGLNP